MKNRLVNLVSLSSKITTNKKIQSLDSGGASNTFGQLHVRPPGSKIVITHPGNLKRKISACLENNLFSALSFMLSG